MSMLHELRSTMRTSISKRDVLVFGVIAATVLTFIVNLPTAVEWYKTGKTDTPLIMSIQSEDEARYISRIREFSEGHPMMGNPFVKEHATDLPPGGFAEYLIAIPKHFFGLSLGQAIGLSDILFPFIIILLTYLWAYAGLRSTVLTIAFITVYYLEIRYGIVRESHPKITLIPFNMYLCVFFYGRRTTSTLLIRGILLGIIFFSYPYHWTYLFVVEACDALASFFSRHSSYKKTLKEGLCVVVPFLLCAVPWILTVKVFVDPAIVQQAYEHLGLIATRTPVAPWLQAIVGCWIIATGALIGTNIRRDEPMKKIFLLLCAALIILNSNYITGTEGEFLGHFGRVFFPLILFACFLVAQAVFSAKWQRTLAYFIIVFSSIAIAHVTLATIHEVPLARKKIDPYQKVIAFINEELPEKSVILAPSELSQILPALTDAYPFMSYATHFFFVPETELTDRYLAFAALFPESLYPYESRFVPVFGNNPGALWAKARTWHAIRSTFGYTKSSFTLTQGDFAQDQTLRQRIDTEMAATNWSTTRRTLQIYDLHYIFSKNVLPTKIRDMFRKIASIDAWNVYERIVPLNRSH